jgi:hypothetical protein
VPNLIVPPYNGIGANEYIVDVTHEVPGPDGKLVPAVDFLSACDTPWPSELNIWYHTLNCGFRTRMSGETDFPCIFDERVGLGRSYIRLDGDLSYDAWCEGISKGTGYVSEGRSHLIDLKVNDTLLGGADVQLAAPGSVKVTAKVAALLDDWVLAEPEWQLGQYGRYRGNERLRRIQHLSPYLKPYWHIERARVGNQRKVNVDVIVNGQVAAQQLIDADGKLRDVSFDVPLRRSSWVALRILGSSHTNPVFVTLGGKPVRASKASAEWCLKGVEVCWKEKKPSYAKAEMADAEAAYNHARAMYRQILAECEE